MSKAFIPEIDSKVRLEKDWTFKLHFEHRNSDLFNADGHKDVGWRDEREPYDRTLPKGSVFSISRIYVRNGAKDFSSVTLNLLETTDEKVLALKPKKKPFSADGTKRYARFWVKLADFNNAEFVKSVWLCDDYGNQIVPAGITDVIKFAGNPKHWKRRERQKVDHVGDYSSDPKLARRNIVFRGFDCDPFEDQLRAYTWDDGNKILKIDIVGE